MRAAAMSVWVFINLLFFGMCGYLYLIWSQYWMYIEKQRLFSKSPGNPQKNLAGINLQETFKKHIYDINFNGNISTLRVDSVHKRSAIGMLWNNGKVIQTSDKSSNSQQHPSSNIIRKSHGSPRFPNIHKPILEFDSEKFVCDDYTTSTCEAQTAEFKELLLKEFHRVLMGDSKVFTSGLDAHNIYDVKYHGRWKEMTRLEAICALRKVDVRTVMADDEPFKSLGFRIPHEGLKAGRLFNTCAVVTSAGALLGSRLGEFIETLCFVPTQNSRYYFTLMEATRFTNLVDGIMDDHTNFPDLKLGNSLYYEPQSTGIVTGAPPGTPKLEKFISQIDSHDMVLRFNNAPIGNYTDDVGSKTTFRVLNSQVVTKREFNFLEDPLYKNISILIWDPANYSSTLEEWYQHPDFPLFPVYKKLLEQQSDADVHLLKPQVLWELWGVLQDSSPYRLRRNPPSSGFIGVWFSMHRCKRVRVFEYVPSARATRRCHYHASRDDTACTLGAWHPLAQEKALAERMRYNSDLDVFQRGFIDIPGVQTVTCTD